MLATGHVVGGDGAEAAQMPDQCAAVLAKGPARLDEAELARLRYGLTDLLDDLIYDRDAYEAMVAVTLWTRAAKLALHAGWAVVSGCCANCVTLTRVSPTGGWPRTATPLAIAAFTRGVLDLVDGPLFDGCHAAGERPDNVPAE